MTTRLLTIAILAVVLVFGSATIALADGIYVSAFLGDDVLGDGSMASPYASIDTAMGMALAGDDIMVAKGIYTENTWLKTGVDIWGAGDDVVFVSSSGDHAFETSGTTDITIDGLSFFGSVGASGPALWAMNTTMTVQFCTFSSNTASETGGAAYLEGSTVTFTGTDFELNEAGDEGGAIDTEGCALSFAGCSFTDNVSLGGDGGAVHIRDDDGETVTFLDCWFTDNVALEGSGAAVDQDSSEDGAVLSFDTVVFTGGWAEDDAGAIDMDDGDLWVMYCTFTDNFADEDGGAIYADEASCTVSGSTFTGNLCNSDGGAFSSFGAWGTITGSTFTSNTADNDGGGVDLDNDEEDSDDRNWSITGSTFTMNRAADAGGAICNDFGPLDNLSVTITDCTITDNHVTRVDYGDDGLSDEENEDGNGGAILCEAPDDSDYCTFTVEASTISGNSAVEKGGGIYVRTFEPDESNETEDFASLISGNTISSNTSGDDGGGLMFDMGREGSFDTSITIIGNTVTSNVAGDDGGGIDVDFDESMGTTCTVANNTVTDNVADNDGGGIEVDIDDAAWAWYWSHDNVFARNTSNDDGGGVSIEIQDSWGTTLTFTGDLIEDNRATNSGGGVDYAVYADPEMAWTFFESCVVRNNEAGRGGGGISLTEDGGPPPPEPEEPPFDEPLFDEPLFEEPFFDGDPDDLEDDVYITLCEVYGNTAGEDGGGVRVWETGYVTVTTSTISANTAETYGGGMRFDDIDEDVRVAGSTVSDNAAGLSAGGIGVRDSWAIFEANTLRGNSAANRGGGIGVNDSFAVLDRNVVSANLATDGGGISTRQSNLLVFNNIIESNEATGSGGGLWTTSRTEIMNNTFVANEAASEEGHAIYRDGRELCPTLNNIFWNHDDDLFRINAQYSLTWEGGVGSVGGDPMFWDEAGGDYRLLTGSPAIDSGEETHTSDATAPEWDFDRTMRPIDGDGIGGAQWDMGAFEMPVPTAPDTIEDSYSLDEDGSLWPAAPGVLGNDSDINGDSLTASLTAGPSNGLLFLAPNGSFAYEPNPDWNGTEYFWYVADDGGLTSGPTTVTITVNPVNDAPVSMEDTATCDEDTFATLDVLANDIDVDMDSLSVTVTAGPSNGTVDLDPSGDATYTPDPHWFGTDYFWYEVSDGTTTSAVATVTITVVSVNDVPVAVDDMVGCDEDSFVTFDVTDNDTDADMDSLSASVTVGPSNGVLEFDASGEATYTPAADWFGTDYFWYFVSDGTTDSAQATVTITVTPVNDPPVGVEDTATCRVDTVATVNVLANDSDVDGGALSAWVSTDPSNGTVDLDPNGDAEYTPDAGWAGTDMFWYQAYDGMDYSAPVTVTITVMPAEYETIAGPNRYATAVEASKQSYPGTTTVVIIATGENWPDALGGAALAGVKDGPILLTEGDSLPAEVSAEITRLGATEAYILGGEGAVSAGVKATLEGMGLAVTRLGGTNRFETARAIAAEVVAEQGAGYDHRAFLCAGANFPDALAASSAAAEMGWPIYLSGPSELATENLVAMLANDALDIVMLGGEGALSAAVEAELDLEFGAANVMRISGANRYATAALVAEWTVDNTALDWDGIAFATGELAPDALAAGPMQASMGSVLLLTPSTSLDDDVRAIITAKRAMINDVRFMGGPAALAPAVKAEIQDIIK